MKPPATNAASGHKRSVITVRLVTIQRIREHLMGDAA